MRKLILLILVLIEKKINRISYSVLQPLSLKLSQILSIEFIL